MREVTADETYEAGNVYGGSDPSIDARHKHIQSIVNEPVNEIYRKYRALEKEGKITLSQYCAVWLKVSSAWRKGKLLSGKEIEQIIKESSNERN